MIHDALYQTYLASLLGGDKEKCLSIVEGLLGEKIVIRELYTQLFQKSMYRVGELWERNEISVAREHLATTITERMLNAVYPYLFSSREAGKKAIISCAANEYHQLGAKMVADIFEIHGWDTFFLGSNTPIDELVKLIDETKPDLIALSFATSFNLPVLKPTLEAIRTHFINLDILVGGHAFQWAGTGSLGDFSGTQYIESLVRLEENL